MKSLEGRTLNEILARKSLYDKAWNEGVRREQIEAARRGEQYSIGIGGI